MPTYRRLDMCYKGRESEFTWKSKQRIRFGRYTDTDQGRFWFVIDFRLPIVDFVLLWNRQITLDTTFRVKKFDFCPSFHEAVCDFELRLKLPS